MNTIVSWLISVVLFINAIFWTLFPHSYHCRVASMLGAKSCPPHIYHVLFGVLILFGALYVSGFITYQAKQ